MSYYPVTVQRLNEETEEWSDVLHLHAIRVNRTGGGESFNAGADQYHPTLTFEFRYCTDLEAVAYSPQIHRLIYRGHTFDVRNYDDYMEQHRTVKLVGMSYG